MDGEVSLCGWGGVIVWMGRCHCVDGRCHCVDGEVSLCGWGGVIVWMGRCDCVDGEGAIVWVWCCNSVLTMLAFYECRRENFVEPQVQLQYVPFRLS